jgi:probable rRNA maturation factor
MLDVDVLGAALAPDAPPRAEIRRLCVAAASCAGIATGHVAIEFADEQRITELNWKHRGLAEPTDVLSFPIDGIEPLAPANAASDRGALEAPPMRELGDVVICAQHTSDVREAIVHGMLHLLGMDHETDSGEMLALQQRLLRAERP